jgi:hypothetical protein
MVSRAPLARIEPFRQLEKGELEIQVDADFQAEPSADDTLRGSVAGTLTPLEAVGCQLTQLHGPRADLSPGLRLGRRPGPSWVRRQARRFVPGGRQWCSSERGQNESVPLNATMSTSCSAGFPAAQLPSGLRGSSPSGLTEPVNVPLAWANSPVASRPAPCRGWPASGRAGSGLV